MSAPSAGHQPPPSERQKEVLSFLVKYICEHGYQPSQKEIAAALGVTKSAIQGRLQELARLSGGED